MFKDVYTTNMSGNGKILKERFEKMNKSTFKHTRMIALLCVTVLISIFAISSLVLAGADDTLNHSTPEILYPFDGECIITSPFSKRVHPITNEVKFHRGVDFKLPIGTDVRAGIEGKVTDNGFDAARGNYVVITNNSGVEITYAHLSQITRRDVYSVTAETVVGKTGNTGMSTGPHLHMEVKINGEYADPEIYLKK